MSKRDFNYKITKSDAVEINTLLYLLDVLPDKNKKLIENIIKNGVSIRNDSVFVITENKIKN